MSFQFTGLDITARPRGNGQTLSNSRLNRSLALAGLQRRKKLHPHGSQYRHASREAITCTNFQLKLLFQPQILLAVPLDIPLRNYDGIILEPKVT
jgi:hypothetical protein